MSMMTGKIVQTVSTAYASLVFVCVSLVISMSESENHSVVSNFVTPWSVACQTPLFMKFSRREYWSG